MLTFLPSLLNSFGKVIPDYWQICYPVSYYFIGAYLYTCQNEIKKISIGKLVTAFLSALTIFTLTDTFASWNQEFQWLDHNDYFGYQTAIMTVLVIAILWRTPIPKWSVRLLKALSTATLTIYLISDLTDQFVYGFLSMKFQT
ncbi:acyltransferase family protein [Lactococcus lactis]